MQFLSVSAGRTVRNRVLSASGDQLLINSGGTASSSRIGSGATVEVSSGGRAVGTVLSSGAQMSVSGGGFATSTTVSAGASLTLAIGADATGTTVLSGGSIQGLTVSSGTVSATAGTFSLSGVTISAGAQWSLGVISGGILSRVTLKSSNGAMAYSGGRIQGATVSKGGAVTVYRGGEARSTTVRSGGVISAYGGTASATTISKGGTVIAYTGSVIKNATVSSGGVLSALSGSILRGTIVLAGSGAVLAVNSRTNTTSAVISGFDEGDAVRLGALGALSSLSASVDTNNCLQITSGGTIVRSLSLTADAQYRSYSLISSGGQIIVTASALINPVTVTGSIANQTVEEGRSFSFSYSADLFSTILDASLVYQATLSDGTSLPSWLQFSSSSRTFSGTPPAGATDYTIKLTAQTADGTYGQSVSFTLATSEPGATQATAFELGSLGGTSTAAALTYGNLVTRTDVDMLRFTVSDAGSYLLYARGTSGTVDFTVVDISGTVIATSTSDGGYDDRAAATLAAGTYYLRVTTTQTADTSYRVHVSSLPSDGIGDTIQTATYLGILAGDGETSTYSGMVGLGDKYDHFQFIVGSPGSLTVVLTTLSSDADLVLYDRTGTQVAASATASIGSESLTYSVTAGTYTVRVAANTDDWLVSDGSFELSLSLSASNSAGTTAARAKSLGQVNATTVVANDWVSGTAVDYYRFVVKSGATASSVACRLFSMTGNADLQILSSDGKTVVAQALQTGTGQETFQKALAAGTYYARVFAGTSSSGNTVQTAYKLDISGLSSDKGANTLALARTTASSQLGTLTRSGTQVSDYVGASDGTDSYLFSLSSTSTVQLSLSELASWGAITARLFTASGSLLREDSLSTDSSSITYSTLAAGSYAVQLVEAGSDTSYLATLSVV